MRGVCVCVSAYVCFVVFVQSLSRVQLCVTLWTADCSTPVFPVLHHLMKLAQAHVH